MFFSWEEQEIENKKRAIRFGRENRPQVSKYFIRPTGFKILRTFGPGSSVLLCET